MSKKQSVSKQNSPGSNKPLGVRMKKYAGFYVMFLPILIFAVIFYYLPMLGVRYAFTNYNGIKDPSFVGFQNFSKMFGMPGFWSAFWNTLQISVIRLILTTLVAVVVSLFLNEIINIHFKKVVQTIIYLPHFLSWVVTASLFSLVLAPTGQGLVNTLLVNMGMVDSNNMIYFLGSSKTWRGAFYVIQLWKETGWQTVIFMATLAGMNLELYEAASIDGAGRWGKMRYITFPALANTILTVIILNLAKVMNLFEAVFVLQNDAVLDVSNVLETYIYYQSFNSGSIPNYGYTTAVGLFKSLVGMALVLICNQWSKKVREGRGIV